MTVGPVPTRYTGRTTAALDRLRRIARQLGPLTERVVFIGGAVAPLLQTEAVLPRVRPTKDVDAVIATSSYADLGPLQETLRACGFTEVSAPTGDAAPTHAHRWIAPDDGGPFDLVPVGSHLGGTGATADTYAVASAIWMDLREHDDAVPCIVRHVSPVAFLLMKWAAHADRGREMPFDSHDLEDIIAVVASRPTIVTECGDALPHVRKVLADQCRAFLVDRDTADELIAAHLPSGVTARVRHDAIHRINAISRLDNG